MHASLNCRMKQQRGCTMRRALFGLATAGAMALAMPGQATTITAADFAPLIGAPIGVIGSYTFATSGGDFGFKTVNLGNQAVGVTGGPSGNEIDVGESIVMTGPAFRLSSLTFAFLYDGPEYGDVQEQVRVTALLEDGGFLELILTTVFDGVNLGISANSSAGSVTNESPATGDADAIWTVSDPFGDALVTTLIFEANEGVGGADCGNGPASCTNQTDYSILRITTADIPEPASLALLGGAALFLGIAGRRRRV